MKVSLVHLAVFLLLASTPSRISGATVTLYSPVADTTISEAFPDKNFGAESALRVGANARQSAFRSMLKFNLTNRIPANGTITAVSLRFVVTRVPPGGQNSWFRLHRFLAPWNEGVGGFSTAQPGETTWNSQYQGTNLWSSPGTTA